MFKFLTKQSVWINLLVVIALVIALIFAFFSSLDWMTKHGDIKKVPSVLGQNIDQATRLLESQGFEVEVQDSVYIDSAAKSSVIRQSPDAEAEVKANRTIFLTINRAVAPLIEMPDLRGYSFLSAKLYLQSLGLKLGDTTYKPDIARNSVLEQTYNKQPVSPGDKVSMGSVIGLVLGDGVGNATMEVPDLIGMTFEQAKSYLNSMNISLGAVVADAGVTDKEQAFVYKQSPDRYDSSDDGQAARKNRIRPGEVVDLWLSMQEPPPPAP